MQFGTPLPVPTSPVTRIPTTIVPPNPKSPSFVINAANKSYKHQYANIYFVRLRILRGLVEERAKRRWKEIAGDPVFVPRVLEVEKRKLCFIIGTVFMDMPMKPNVLDDIARDHSIPAPAPRPKYYSDEDAVMLEDESGRIRLVGERLRTAGLVTGVIMGALGMETQSGDFEVVDYCFAGMAPQDSVWPKTTVTEDMDVDVDSSSPSRDEWIALVSGLQVGDPSPADAQIELLTEFLTGELGGEDDQTKSSRISRVIIAGNSLAPAVSVAVNPEEVQTDKKLRRYGQETTTFTTHPTENLSGNLLDIARSMPIHILPGASDPAWTILPQQPLPRAMFGGASAFSTFTSETNPTYIQIGPSSAVSSPSSGNASSSKTSASTSTTPTRTLLVNSGQPLDDMFKYLASPPHDRLSLAESTLHWRHMAPTAPDTLWCHPYFTTDPFVISQTPDLYIIGNQPRFATRMVTEKESGKRCRVVLVPGFRETGTIALVNLRNLEVKTVCFKLEGMTGEVEA
ncbi:DNA polymerase alpha/epsilon subunit B-domain-containing protein [Cristinia sonorae]|uniref:DNA-directed DNA polymerase n=1 Tax=Cristinia sonorae TaxID=1940300 RepID=A0A8K0XUN4_9AGAR|nr:DNA polymerase alpha/epsilon subunit B-domain-containing protein [Cristinia sonorae]